jgi:hypothetical protein
MIDGIPYQLDFSDLQLKFEVVFLLESGYNLAVVLVLSGGRCSQTVYDERKSPARSRYVLHRRQRLAVE